MTTSLDATQAVRDHIVKLLSGGSAYATFDDVVKDMPFELQGKVPPGLRHSPWMLLEHMRIAQWDILEFSRNEKHVSPTFPKGYWPVEAWPPGPTAWEESANSFRADLKAMQDLVTEARTDLFAKIPWGDGQTILREALLVADHNAYHLGQLVDARRLLGAWVEE